MSGGKELTKALAAIDALRAEVERAHAAILRLPRPRNNAGADRGRDRRNGIHDRVSRADDAVFDAIDAMFEEAVPREIRYGWCEHCEAEIAVWRFCARCICKTCHGSGRVDITENVTGGCEDCDCTGTKHGPRMRKKKRERKDRAELKRLRKKYGDGS